MHISQLPLFEHSLLKKMGLIKALVVHHSPVQEDLLFLVDLVVDPPAEARALAYLKIQPEES